MNPFCEMLRKITSSSYNDQMLRFAAPLNDHFGINHFWYYRITFSGFYSYLGTHLAWNEFCFDKALLSNFPCLRHPNNLQNGINLMKANIGSEYKKVLDIAWEKFQINFSINILNRIPEGIEAFGFGTRFNDPYAEQRLLNDLPLLRFFIKLFQTKHKKLFQLLEDNQVNLSDQFGPLFFEHTKSLTIPREQDQFLSKMGLGSILLLTPREKDVLKIIANGFSAPYIAKELRLHKRTVENYIATIKSKLSCNSKVELIKKAQEIASINYFD